MNASQRMVPRPSIDRLLARLEALGEIGAIPHAGPSGGGSARLALTDEDRRGRDLVVSWMRDLGLDVSIDGLGNVIAVWRVGDDPNGAPVMMGSHIDTVRTGGKFDGNLGVLAGLEVIEALQTAELAPLRPLAVAFFTNEEGARFAPDMMGSLVYVGGLGLEEALDVIGIDGARVGDEVERIGYGGSLPSPGPVPHSFVELHIEQGPVLEEAGVTIGAVTGVQGISWTEVTVTGRSSHAGTTPMRLRVDPLVVAGRIIAHVREVAVRMGGDQVATVGRVAVFPNLVNVVPASVTLTVDVRNTDETLLQQAEADIFDFIEAACAREGCEVTRRTLARFEPVEFEERVVELVESTARNLGYTVQRMPSGAGHDAQMLARVCPTAMIFTPSVGGLSHNPAEFTDRGDLLAGASVLIDVVWRLANEP